MKKALILVLSHHDHPYGRLMNTSRNTWDSVQVPGVETIFYLGCHEGIQSHDNILYTNIEDSFFNMGHKTLLAFEHALEHTDFDYIARVNSSCYVHKQNLIDHCQELPDKNLFKGLVGDSGHGKYMWGGGYYILSRDVIQKVVDNKHLWDHSKMEDFALSAVCQQLGIPLTEGGKQATIHQDGRHYDCIMYNDGMGFTRQESLGILKGTKHFFFRIKQDRDRTLDWDIMMKLHQTFTT